MQNESVANETTEAAHDLARNVEDTVKTIFETTRAVTSKALKATQEKLEETLEENENAINVGVHRTLNLIKQYPLESAVACLGVGFLVGKLLNRPN